MTIYEWIKVLNIRTSRVCNLFFRNNTVLWCFFLINDVCVLIPSLTAQIFFSYYRTHKTYTSTNYRSKCRNWNKITDSRNKNKENIQSNVEPYTLFYVFHSLNHDVLFHINDNFSFIYFLVQSQGLPYLSLKYLYVILLFFL